MSDSRGPRQLQHGPAREVWASGAPGDGILRDLPGKLHSPHAAVPLLKHAPLQVELFPSPIKIAFQVVLGRRCIEPTPTPAPSRRHARRSTKGSVAIFDGLEKLAKR